MPRPARGFCFVAGQPSAAFNHAGNGPVDDAGVRPFRIAELTGLFKSIRAANYAGVNQIGMRFLILPPRPDLAPVLRRVIFFGQPHLGAGFCFGGTAPPKSAMYARARDAAFFAL